MSSLKHTFRDFIAILGERSGLLAAVSRIRLHWVVLTFHRVLPAELREKYPLKGLAITPDELSWILSQFKGAYQVKTVSEAYRELRNAGPDGRGYQPTLSITFDDGQFDNLLYAAPVLREQDMVATFYVPTQYIGSKDYLWHDKAGFLFTMASLHVSRNNRSDLVTNFLRSAGMTPTDCRGFVRELKERLPHEREKIVDSLEAIVNNNWQERIPEDFRMLTWEEVDQLSKLGHEIGSHGRTHNSLHQLDSEEQQREIVESAREIEKNLGTRVESFCYPNGDYNSKTLSCMHEAGYGNAVTTIAGKNRHETGKYELHRFDMNRENLVDRRGRLSKGRLLMRLNGMVSG